MLTGKIEFTGKTLSDVQYAIEEATRRIMGEMTSGADRNEDGSFNFEVDGAEEVVWPYRGDHEALR